MAADYPPDKSYRERHGASGNSGRSSCSNSMSSANFTDDGNSNLTKSLSARCLNRMKFWKNSKKTFKVTEPDPTYKCIYLGNVVTPWAKGDNCVDKPLDTLWRNYCANMKHEIGMKLTICNQGLKAITREHGLTEYWANRITRASSHTNYPKVFCWIYRHEGRKMKQELRCHAVLCRNESSPPRMAQLLNAKLTTALAEFKREKRLRQNARISLAGSVHELQMPLRKQMLIKGMANFRPPLERSKSAPKLHSIVETSEEFILEEDEEDDEYVSSYVGDTEDIFGSDLDTEVETTSGCGVATENESISGQSLASISARSALSEPAHIRSRSSSLRTQSSARSKKKMIKNELHTESVQVAVVNGSLVTTSSSAGTDSYRGDDEEDEGTGTSDGIPTSSVDLGLEMLTLESIHNTQTPPHRPIPVSDSNGQRGGGEMTPTSFNHHVHSIYVNSGSEPVIQPSIHESVHVINNSSINQNVNNNLSTASSETLTSTGSGQIPVITPDSRSSLTKRVINPFQERNVNGFHTRTPKSAYL